MSSASTAAPAGPPSENFRAEITSVAGAFPFTVALFMPLPAVGEIVTVQRSATGDMASPTTLTTFAITQSHIDNIATTPLPLALPSSGTGFIRVTIGPRVFNVVKYGSAAAPTFVTGPAYGPVPERQSNTITVTCSEPCYLDISLDDTVQTGLFSVPWQAALSHTVTIDAADYEVSTSLTPQLRLTNLASVRAAQSAAVSVSNVVDTPTLSPGFVSVQNAVDGTPYSSTATVVLGAGITLPITAFSGTILKNGVALTLPATVQNGDTLTASANGPAANTVVAAAVTIDGVAFNWTCSGVLTLPDTGNLKLQLEADDLSTLFQLVNGTTPVTTDSQTVGTWNDKSGNGFHLAAAADNATRPLWRSGSGLPYVSFDGGDDLLKRASALGLYATGNWAVAMSYRATTITATSRTAFGESSATNSNPVYHPLKMSTSGTLHRATARYRGDNTTNVENTLKDNVWQAAPHAVIVQCTGGVLSIIERDGSTGSVAFAPPTTTGLDRFGIGAAPKNSPDSFMGIDVFCFAAWTGATLDTTGKQNQALTYVLSKIGEVL